MSAVIVDGAAIAKSIRAQLKAEVEEYRRTYSHSFNPKLVIVVVGDRADSKAYIEIKRRACKEIGIELVVHHFEECISQTELIANVRRLCASPDAPTVMIQYPLPDHISRAEVASAVEPVKDMDGFHARNIGMLTKRGKNPLFMPCPSGAVMEILARYNVQIAGRQAVVIGRSDIAGTPTAIILARMDATVTLCHSETPSSILLEVLNQADIVVVAIGKPEYIRGEWLKSGAVVIDVGMNWMADDNRKCGWKVAGDVHYDSARRVASLLSTVPGGVGPVTMAMIMSNTVLAAKRQVEEPEDTASLVEPNWSQVSKQSHFDIDKLKLPVLCHS
ncbi:C-1-tetrahydrofolate synthase, cytoplasmic [Ramicandelaber brevisporus]|nr:C-1-tetrahydrofolate synthase, cytoplasmic [Ramicandelaber brevisporus]